MTQTKLQNPKLHWRDSSATKVVASTLGVLTGLTGIEHGFLEMLQGNVATNGIVIDAIGTAQRFWEGGSEPAMTLIPNFVVTGILAMTIGLLLIVCSVAFVNRKYSAPMLILLTIILLLVGGGFAPIPLGILAGVTATRINKPLTWWRAHLPVNVRGFLTKVWLWSLGVFVILILLAIVVAIIGWPLLLIFDEKTIVNILDNYLIIICVPMLLSILGAFSYDMQKQMQNPQQR